MGTPCQKTHSPFVSQHTDTVTHTRQRDTAGMAGSHMRAHTHRLTHSALVAKALSGLGDLAELWLTLIGSLHHTTSHLDGYWLLDQTTGS